MSHAAGVGAPFPREIVRAMLLLRANTLALGHSGCRPLLVDRLLDFLRLGPPPGRAGAGERRRVRRPRAAGAPRAAAHRARRGGAGRDRRSRRPTPLRDAGLEPLRARGEGGAGAPQRHPDDGRDRGARAGRRRSAGTDRQRRRGDVRRGAARDGRGVRGGLPAGPAAPGPDRGRRGAAPPAARQRSCRPATTGTPTRSRTRTRCAARRRSTARSATPSTTSAGSSTSS